MKPTIPLMRIFSLITLLVLSFCFSQAATHNVSGETELAAAIAASNTSGVDDTIVFTGNIGLDAALPDINKETGELTIEGGNFTLSRSSGVEVPAFDVISVRDGDVSIENLTVSGGSQGIYMEHLGTLTMTNCNVSHNDRGVSTSGPLTMVNCNVSNNELPGLYWGGGFFFDGDDVQVVLTGCTISNNSASAAGGLYNRGSTLTMTNCIVSGNSASSEDVGDVGGVYNYGGTVTMTDCTVTGNSADHNIGGVYNFGGTMTITNCTVSGNSAANVVGGIASRGTMTVTHCTVAGNSAASHVGGIFQDDGTMTLHRCLVVGNSAGDVADEIYINLGTIIGDSYNVLGDSSKTTAQAFWSFTPGASDVNATSDGGTPTALASILVTTLANNGGPTLTHNLVAGSPAIDIATEQGDSPSVDQRGYARPQGAGFDAGAVEFGSAPAVDVDEDNGDPEEPAPTALFEEYWHTVTSNTITARNWNLDPNSILGDSPAHSFASGALPRGLSLLGVSLIGRFADLGSYGFTIVSRNDIYEVRNHFQVRVIPPAVSPLISGIWVNDQYHSMNIMEARGHGVAAVTELFSVNANVGEPLTMVFDWDYIKDDSSFKIIRGVLPQGMALKKQHVNGFPSAAITGSPTEAGEFIFVVSVLDWRGRGYQWIRLVVE